ncbi:hypothetical protein CYMTET_19349 [Cymbomonas tetramitiformis]|uniref:Uncharacterized protein n=1 Tax=Cymbomonas tetramitiformis TaxID=36881 RepID=A0AAE0G6A8_9CHLO|nr:hypothetical protein CYMTET_19349 [Cymbomonas tetramitiformis]
MYRSQTAGASPRGGAGRHLVSMGQREESVGADGHWKFVGTTDLAVAQGHVGQLPARVQAEDAAVCAWDESILAELGAAERGCGAEAKRPAKPRFCGSRETCSRWVLRRWPRLKGAVLRGSWSSRWKRLGWALEAVDFEEMRWARPQLPGLERDINELPAGEEASEEDWQAVTRVLQERVANIQAFAWQKEPGSGARGRPQGFLRLEVCAFPLTGRQQQAVNPRAAACRSDEGDREELTAYRREELAKAGAGLRVVSNRVTPSEIQKFLKASEAQGVSMPPAPGSNHVASGGALLQVASGGALMQDVGRGLQTIALQSRPFSGAEQSYNAGEQELCALHHCIGLGGATLSGRNSK